MSTPPVVIIIGPHAYHFPTLSEAQAFIASYAGEDAPEPDSL